MGTLKQSTEAVCQISKAKQEIIRKINERLSKLQSQVLIFVFITALGCTLQSCDKDYQDPVPTPPEPPIERELISQSFTLTTAIKDIQMSKSFNPNVWEYNYSDQKFELKLSNQWNTYTKQVSIQEIKAGTVILQMFAGTYNVSYNPIHSPLYSDKLDVSINMSNVNVNGTPIALTGVLEDALFIVDIPKNILYPYPSAVCDNRGVENPKLLYDSTNDFYYGYTNIKPIHPLTIYFLDNSFGSVDVPNFQKGKVYWMSKEQNGTIQLTIPSLTVERIVL